MIQKPLGQIRENSVLLSEAFKDPDNGTIHVYVYGIENKKIVLHDLR